VAGLLRGLLDARRAGEDDPVGERDLLAAGDLLLRLRKHAWLRAFWYAGK
jgi:hypothetical protein